MNKAEIAAEREVLARVEAVDAERAETMAVMDKRVSHSLEVEPKQRDVDMLLYKHSEWLKQQPEYGRIQAWPRAMRRQVDRSLLKQLFKTNHERKPGE